MSHETPNYALGLSCFTDAFPLRTPFLTDGVHLILVHYSVKLDLSLKANYDKYQVLKTIALKTVYQLLQFFFVGNAYFFSRSFD